MEQDHLGVVASGQREVSDAVRRLVNAAFLAMGSVGVETIRADDTVVADRDAVGGAASHVTQAQLESDTPFRVRILVDDSQTIALLLR
jgi:hypothetical protein